MQAIQAGGIRESISGIVLAWPWTLYYAGIHADVETWLGLRTKSFTARPTSTISACTIL